MLSGNFGFDEQEYHVTTERDTYVTTDLVKTPVTESLKAQYAKIDLNGRLKILILICKDPSLLIAIFGSLKRRDQT